MNTSCLRCPELLLSYLRPQAGPVAVLAVTARQPPPRCGVDMPYKSVPLLILLANLRCEGRNVKSRHKGRVSTAQAPGTNTARMAP